MSLMRKKTAAVGPVVHVGDGSYSRTSENKLGQVAKKANGFRASGFGKPKTARAKSVKKKLASLPTLRKKAWAAFSKYIRYKDQVCEGDTVRCVTCEVAGQPAEFHAGHFIHCSRQSRLSYDERNIHVQCRQCNFYGAGGLAPIKYTIFMQQKYGPGIVDELLAMKHSSVYLKRADLEAIIEKYRKWA